MIDREYTIDGHSHIAYEDENYIIGSNYCWDIIPTLEKYKIIAEKNKIYKSLLTPCTSPEIINKITGVKKNLILWEYKNNEFEYFCQICDRNSVVKLPLSVNPYKEINDFLFECLINFENLYFVPAINLIYDTPKYIEKLIDSGIKALKVHGISIGLDNFDKINIELLKIISRYDIPLVVHTDYHVKTSNPIDILYNANNPINWINLLKRFDIRGYLAHGCRLSYECAQLVNSSGGQFLVGISPDLLLEDEQDRLIMPTNNYLATLVNFFCDDYLSFDIDFGWNKINRMSNQLDSDQLNRLQSIVTNEKTLTKILRKNSETFFKMR